MKTIVNNGLTKKKVQKDSMFTKVNKQSRGFYEN